MMICENCGKENRAGSKYCRFCGVKLTEITVQPQAGETENEISASFSASQAQAETAVQAENHDSMAEAPAQLDEAEGMEPETAPETTVPGAEEDRTTISGETYSGELKADRSEIATTETHSAPAGVASGAEPASPTEPGEVPLETAPVSESGPAAPAADDVLEGEVQRHGEDPGASLEAGVILNGRYRILDSVVEQTPEGEQQLRYQAEDLLACWNCQAVQTETDPQFCEVCGAELNQKPLVYLRAEKEVTSTDLYNSPGVGFVEGGQLYIVERMALPSNEAGSEGPVILAAGYATDTGREREANEDSLLAFSLAGRCENRSAPTLGLYLVADGIGGHDAGEVASRTAIQNLASKILENVAIAELSGSPIPSAGLSDALVHAVQAANTAILQLREGSQQGSNMGCTITAALVREMEAVIANVGDSRTYLLRSGKLSQVTKDHSLVARWVEQGAIRPEELYTHEQRSVIYRSLGDRPDVEVDTFNLSLEPGDRLLLCSDGLWEMVRDPSIEDTLLERNDPQDACDRLVEQANLAGGEDNIAIVILNVERPF